MLTLLRSDYNVEAQGGQAQMADRLLRLGHMGWAHEAEIREAMAAIGDATLKLREFGATRIAVESGVT